MTDNSTRASQGGSVDPGSSLSGVAATVWLNGSFVAPEEARVSGLDAGLQHGVGLFETMTAVGGRVFFLDAHANRLRASAAALGLSRSVRAAALGEAVTRVARRASESLCSGSRLRIRLTVTGGGRNLLAASRGHDAPHEPTVLIVAQSATVYPPALFARGAFLTIADYRANPLDPTSGHKTLNYWARLRALQLAASKGADEALVLQVSNHVAGGAVSNIFAVRDGVLCTPLAHGEEAGGALPSPVLPGVTRSFVLGAVQERGMETSTRMCALDDFLDADEVFLTNASWGVFPVTRIEGKEIGSGAPGPVGLDLRTAWLSALDALASG